MENASKALIMAASVLVGVMLFSLIVFLFNTFGSYSENAMNELNTRQLAEFNNQFFKYQTGADGSITISKVHDLISVANLAKQNNENYGYDSSTYRSNSNYYIQVTVPGYSNFEKQSEQKYIEYIKNNLYTDRTNTTIKQYVCKSIQINPNNKRVNYISFEVK